MMSNSAPVKNITQVTLSYASENIIANARIKKLEQTLDWFASGCFIEGSDYDRDLAWRVIQRARGAIKYLSDKWGFKALPQVPYLAYFTYVNIGVAADEWTDL